MDLKDFVRETLSQIFEGVRDAQQAAQESGGFVNPYLLTLHREFTIGEMPKGAGERVSLVEFDVALTITEKKGSAGGLGVIAGPIALGSKGQSHHDEGSITRVSFSVPIQLPTQKDKRSDT